MMAMGELRFEKAVYSDREINYRIDPSGAYDIGCNRVLYPQDGNPGLPAYNFDGSPPVDLLENIHSVVKVVTATTSMGLFSSTTIDGNTQLFHEYTSNIFLTKAYGTNGSLTTPPGSTGVSAGDIAVMKVIGSGGYDTANPIPWLAYRITSINGGSVMTFERPIVSGVNSRILVYPQAGPAWNRWDTGPSGSSVVLNLNIA
jgi:hypothetical protein